MLTAYQLLHDNYPQATGGLLDKPVWGVVSTWAADTLYEGLTFDQAIQKARDEAKEPGRDAVVVLLIRAFDGPPLT